MAQRWSSPTEAFATLTQKTHIMALQGGEPGPFAQAIAGLDIALWDLLGRRADQSLWQFLGGTHSAVSTYASGLNPEDFEGIVEQKLADGYNAFKIKVGYNREMDFVALNSMRQMIGGRR